MARYVIDLSSEGWMVSERGGRNDRSTSLAVTQLTQTFHGPLRPKPCINLKSTARELNCSFKHSEVTKLAIATRLIRPRRGAKPLDFHRRTEGVDTIQKPSGNTVPAGLKRAMVFKTQ